MFVMGNVLLGLATVLDYALWFYMWIIIARALISWVNPDPWNPIVQFWIAPPSQCCHRSADGWDGG